MNGQDFLLDTKLGEGVFGDVHIAHDLVRGGVVALKRICKYNSAVSSDIRASYLQEIRCGELLTHFGIAKVIGHFETTKHYWLVMEFVNGMELITLLQNRKFEPLSEELTKRILGQVVNALAYAHRMGCAHLDVKLDNILVDAKGNTKLIDWGLSTCDDPVHCFKYCGSLEYSAPEIFQTSGRCAYNAYQADSFSLGVVLYALLCGKFPFNKQELQSMRKGEIVQPADINEENITQQAKDLIKSLLNPDPTHRMNIQQLEKDPWLQSQ